MKETATTPSPVARQVSGLGPEGKHLLSVLAKRTYRIQPNGQCVLAEEQIPLVTTPVALPENPKVLQADVDTVPIKPMSDVVLLGHAYPFNRKPIVDASIRIGSAVKSISVIGDRHCALSSTGSMVFSDPSPFDRMPLRYDRAYGGRDAVAEEKHGNPFALLKSFMPNPEAADDASPFIYPRNSAGTGFVIERTKESVERLKLPNLEDPRDRLSPHRLFVETSENWPSMPLPQAFSWVAYGWFPRIAYFGVIPPHKTLQEPIMEVARGLAQPDLLKHRTFEDGIDYRFFNGASLGLQFPFLRGTEEITLANIHPQEPHFKLKLPGQRPKIWTDGRNGKFNKTDPVIHTVLIEPDESRLSIVWRGSATALRPYMPDELEKMPFRVEW